MLVNVAPLLLLHSLGASAAYVLKDKFQGSTFFDNFDFFTGADPTHGFVQYVDEATARNNGLISTSGGKVYMGVDHTTYLDPSGSTGRQSVRLQSKKTYTRGLFIGDFNHMPGGQCGIWPSFWTLGPSWPSNGEIDIIEGVNSATQNLISLHTGANCTTAGSGETGTLLTNNCYQYASNQDNTGCGVQDPRTNSFGLGYDGVNGGVYAMEWTSTSIKVWWFPRSNIPANIKNGNPAPSTWGQPVANFGGGCNIANHFNNHQIVFTNTFCGDWAGPAFLTDSKCKSKSSSCQTFVANNPGSYQNSYWNINSVAVYTLQGAAAAPEAQAETKSVKPLAETGTLTITAVAAGATGPPPKGVTGATGTTTISVNQTPGPPSRRRRGSPKA